MEKEDDLNVNEMKFREENSASKLLNIEQVTVWYKNGRHIEKGLAYTRFNKDD